MNCLVKTVTLLKWTGADVTDYRKTVTVGLGYSSYSIGALMPLPFASFPALRSGSTCAMIAIKQGGPPTQCLVPLGASGRSSSVKERLQK